MTDSLEVEGSRWVTICQQDWYALWPGEYFPDRPRFGTCALCEDVGLVVSVNPKEITKAKKEARS